MDRNFARALSLVLKSEGGFINDARDPGGATNLGVTIGQAKAIGLDIDHDGDTDIVDIKLLTAADAGKVYKHYYWDAVAGDDLPDGVDYAVFDFAVNSGDSRAARYLQAVVGADQDGSIGPETLAAVRAKPAGVTIDHLCDARLAFMKVAKNAKGVLLWPTFGKGWSARVASVRTEALKMTAQTAQPAAPAPVQPVRAPQAPDARPAPPAPTPPPAAKSPITSRPWYGPLVAALFIGPAMALANWWHELTAWLHSFF